MWPDRLPSVASCPTLWPRPKRLHQAGQVFDLTLPFDQVGEGYRAMHKRRAFKRCLRFAPAPMILERERVAASCTLAVTIALPAMAQEKRNGRPPMQIKRSGSQPSQKGPEAWFTG